MPDSSKRLARIQFLGLLSFCLSIFILGLLFQYFYRTSIGGAVLIISFIIAIINIIWICIKRLHDVDSKGWWLLLALIPLVGQLWLLAIIIIPGTKGINRFGAQPDKPKLIYYFLIFTAPICFYILLTQARCFPCLY